MKKTIIKVKLTFLEGLLGTAPADPDIYGTYVAGNAPDAATIEEEIEAHGVEAVQQKGRTILQLLEDGRPFLYDYQIRGFFKDACGMLSRLGGSGKDKQAVNESSRLKAYRKVIDGLIFVEPRKIPIDVAGEIGDCQRTLRANTAQGDRIAIASSDEAPAGSTIEFSVICLDDRNVKAVKEWLDYGCYRGIGQWRNSGKGKFTWELLEERTEEQ